jgi:hypothetical protein
MTLIAKLRETWAKQPLNRRSVLLAALGLFVAVAAALGISVVGRVQSTAEAWLAGPRSVEITSGSKRGLLEAHQYSLVRDESSWRLTHSPPCPPGDAGCSVDLVVKGAARGAIRNVVFVVVFALALVLFSTFVLLLAPRRVVTALHGRKFHQSHVMTLDGQNEICEIRRVYEGVRTSAESILIPIQLNYVNRYLPNQLPIELSEPRFVWDGTSDKVRLTRVNLADAYYNGIVWFTDRQGPVTFRLNYTVYRNMYRDLPSLIARKGPRNEDNPACDDHTWRATANWDEVKFELDWSNGFRVSDPEVHLRNGPGAAERPVPVGDPRLSVTRNSQGQVWVIALNDVPTGTEVRIRWAVN